MSSVNVTIFSRSYNIACQPGEEEKLHSAAEMFNDELMRLKQHAGNDVEFEKLIVVAGMNMCARHRKVLKTYTDDMQTVMNHNIDFAEQLSNLPTPSALTQSAVGVETQATEAEGASAVAGESDNTDTDAVADHQYIRTEADNIIIEDTSDASEGLNLSEADEE